MLNCVASPLPAERCWSTSSGQASPIGCPLMCVRFFGQDGIRRRCNVVHNTLKSRNSAPFLDSRR